MKYVSISEGCGGGGGGGGGGGRNKELLSLEGGGGVAEIKRGALPESVLIHLNTIALRKAKTEFNFAFLSAIVLCHTG